MKSLLKYRLCFDIKRWTKASYAKGQADLISSRKPQTTKNWFTSSTIDSLLSDSLDDRQYNSDGAVRNALTGIVHRQ